MKSPLWLAHHRGAGLVRCFNIGGLHVCARCTGLLPVVLVTLLCELRHPLALPLNMALALEVLLLAPALWDIARGSALPLSGNNALRLLSGAALGLVVGHAAAVAERVGPVAPEALLPALCCVGVFLWVVPRSAS